MFDFSRLDKLLTETGISKAHLCSLVGRERYYIRDAKNKAICSYYTTPLAAYQLFFSENNRKYLPIFMYEKCHILTAKNEYIL